jgi:serine phosphatase RsbU (regulator of sigma subunit)
MEKQDIKESRIDSINDRLWANRFDNSKSVANEAFKNLARAEESKYLKGIAYAKLIIANANFLQSRNDISLKYLTEALQWFRKGTDKKGYVRAILLKGNLFESFGDYEKTLSLWLEAYNISKETRDIESEGESCSQLGLIYSRLSDTEKALDYFRRGLKIREKLGDENGIASSFNRIGMVLRQTGKYKESLEYYFRSLAIRIKNNQISSIPWTHLGIASTYEDMKMYPESLDYYERGMDGSDKRCTLQCLLGSGRVYSHKGEVEKAQARLSEALQIAKDLKSQVLIAETHSALASHYELSGQPVKAIKSLKQFLRVKESYQSSETRNRLRNIEVANAIEKSEQEKEIYRLKHVELKQAYDIIEEKNRDITASINYASRIQTAILPSLNEVKGLSKKLFILYLPKDIVSGDFYWFSRKDDKLIIVAGDCTGHGVPGALMSMLGISFLEEIVTRRGITESGEILNELRKEIKRALHQTGNFEEAKDGMDISLCVIDNKSSTIQYSGAYNNLYMIRDGELIEYQADRMPIGIFDVSGKNFSSQNITSRPGDLIYMFSDGYADQFGGPNSKKFKYSSFKNLLIEIHKFPLQKQKEKLKAQFLKWKGSSVQIDDVLILGFIV